MQPPSAVEIDVSCIDSDVLTFLVHHSHNRIIIRNLSMFCGVVKQEIELFGTYPAFEESARETAVSIITDIGEYGRRYSMHQDDIMEVVRVTLQAAALSRHSSVANTFEEVMNNGTAREIIMDALNERDEEDDFQLGKRRMDEHGAADYGTQKRRRS